MNTSTQDPERKSRFCTTIFEFFAVNTKLSEMAILASKDLTAATKVMSSGTQPDDHWIKRLLLIPPFSTARYCSTLWFDLIKCLHSVIIFISVKSFGTI